MAQEVTGDARLVLGATRPHTGGVAHQQGWHRFAGWVLAAARQAGPCAGSAAGA